MRTELRGTVIVAALLALGSLWAAAEEGPLRKDPPTGTTPEEIIRRFTAKEKEFKEALNLYGYRETVKVQVLDGDTVTGDFQRVADYSFDDAGKKLRNVVFAPQATFTNIEMNQADFDDLEDRMPFTLSSDELPQYNVLYVGQQMEDELHCYVFDIAPKQFEKGKRYFQGRLWVDDKDFQIVKNYGKSVPDTHLNKKGKGQENLFPKFTTWREQVDGKYWFPTYSYADDVLHFVNQDVHIKQTVKYTNYAKFGSSVKITYEGKQVEKTPGQDKPEDKPKQ